jgi:hypothetical protein
MLLEEPDLPSRLQGRRRSEMKLGGHMDYHGSRAYAPEPTSATAGSWVKRLGGQLASWTRQKLDLMLRPGAKQAAETIWLFHGNERHFSLLGSDSARKRRRAAAPCPFPEGEARIRRPIGVRADSE